MCAAACFMLALTHLLLWIRSRWRPEYLLSTGMAAAAGCNALLEMAEMFSAEAPAYFFFLRLQLLCVCVMLVSLTWFVRLYLGAGSKWLLWTISLLWLATVVVNFLSPTGAVFSTIEELTINQTYWGESFVIARGSIHPLKFLSDIASLLILVYLLHASYVAWHNGRRRRALTVGGGSVFFIVLAGIHTPLVDAGIVKTPYMIGFAFLAIVVALTYQLVRDALEANRYANEMERMSRTTLLGEVAAGLAHELNQPLSAILSNAQAARRHLGGDEPDLVEIAEIVDDIIVDDKRAGDIIHGLRGMLRQQPTEIRPVDMNTEIRFVAELVAGELRTRDIDLELRLDPGLPAVAADGVQVQQVVMNLLLNAARAIAKSENSARKISVDSSQAEDAVVVRIADTGAGIDADSRERLFEPFFSNHDGGLGMGLTVSRRIVERFGGRLWAENGETGGAIFSYSMPTVSRTHEATG
ncbi:MAG: ATP-binding protein [Gammaproteobacteria bacterium]